MYAGDRRPLPHRDYAFLSVYRMILDRTRQLLLLRNERHLSLSLSRTHSHTRTHAHTHKQYLAAPSDEDSTLGPNGLPGIDTLISPYPTYLPHLALSLSSSRLNREVGRYTEYRTTDKLLIRLPRLQLETQQSGWHHIFLTTFMDYTNQKRPHVYDLHKATCLKNDWPFLDEDEGSFITKSIHKPRLYHTLKLHFGYLIP